MFKSSRQQQQQSAVRRQHRRACSRLCGPRSPCAVVSSGRPHPLFSHASARKKPTIPIDPTAGAASGGAGAASGGEAAPAGNSTTIIIAVVVPLVCIAIIAAGFVLYRKRMQHARSEVDHALCCVPTRDALVRRGVLRRTHRVVLCFYVQKAAEMITQKRNAGL